VTYLEEEFRENITFQCERAENPRFQDDTFDLIIAQQGVEYFNHRDFNKTAEAILKVGGILALVSTAHII